MAVDEADKAGEAVAVWRLKVAHHGGVVMKSFQFYRYALNFLLCNKQVNVIYDNTYEKA
jgi:hypothetical protein